MLVDCIAIRMKGGHYISNRSFERMIKALVLFMKDNNMLRVLDPISLRLRKETGNLEGKGTLRDKQQNMLSLLDPTNTFVSWQTDIILWWT